MMVHDGVACSMAFGLPATESEPVCTEIALQLKCRKQLKALVLQAFAVLPMLWTIHPVVLPWHRSGGNIPDGRRVLRNKNEPMLETLLVLKAGK